MGRGPRVRPRLRGHEIPGHGEATRAEPRSVRPRRGARSEHRPRVGQGRPHGDPGTRGRGPGRRRGRTDSGVRARDREDSLSQGAHRCTARGAREADREPGSDDRGGRETRNPRPRALGTDPVQIDLRNRCWGHPDFRPRDRLARPDPGRDRRDDRRTGAGMSDLVVLHEVPDSKHGKAPEDRSITERIRLGVAIVDKPAGPTSHQVSAWVRDMFGVPKAGHSGTLDPRVTGVLPVALADATRAIEAVLAGDKDYIGVFQLHQDVDPRRVRSMMARFVGEIYQVPPVRSAVKREQRTRHVFELEPLEIDGRDVLFRVRCESGTYIRTLAVDLGEALGVGANLVDLRRTRTAGFTESDARPLNAFRDALAFAKEGDETAVRTILRPMEDLLRHLPRIVVKDTAVDSICHGANLAVPGVAKLSPHIHRGASVGVFTGKGEAVALSKALMTTDEIVIAKSGAAADTGRVLMTPGTYPKLWK